MLGECQLWHTLAPLGLKRTKLSGKFCQKYLFCLHHRLTRGDCSWLHPRACANQKGCVMNACCFGTIVANCGFGKLWSNSIPKIDFKNNLILILQSVNIDIEAFKINIGDWFVQYQCSEKSIPNTDSEGLNINIGPKININIILYKILFFSISDAQGRDRAELVTSTCRAPVEIV